MPTEQAIWDSGAVSQLLPLAASPVVELMRGENFGDDPFPDVGSEVTTVAAMSKLVRHVAHESNNLLAIISLNLEEAVEMLPPGSDLHLTLTAALEAAFQSSDLNVRLLASIQRP